jgi:hypothetical protein
MPSIDVPPIQRRPSSRQKRKSRTEEIYAELRSRDRLRIERFPVTILLGAQMILTILLPAYEDGTRPFGIMSAICGTTIAAALYVELFLIRWKGRPGRPVSISTGAAKFVLLVGVLSTVGATLGGQGSYAVQVGLAEQSAVVALLSPFTTWLLFGAVLFMWLYREGRVPRRQALFVLAGTILLQLAIGIERAILGQAMAFAVTLVVVAIFARLIRLRALIVALLLIPILWPPIYDYRNSVRQDLTGSSIATQLDNPIDRLKFDEQMALVTQLTPRPPGLTVPSPDLLIRTGLFPRALDPNRPAINTGTQLNVALGRGPLSATSATMMGNVYIFNGLVGVGIVGALIALGMKISLRRSSPWALSLTGLIYLNTMSFNASYPDVVPKMLQALVSMVIAMIVARAFSKRQSE